MKKYRITCNEEQLRLIANSIEDWSRFISGQCELDNATHMVEPVENMHEVRDILDKQVRPLIVPDLPYPGSSYGWSGGDCPNDHQRKAIAMSYGIYREIRHFLAMQHPEDSWNVYLSETLRCPDQGPLIKIEEIEED